MPNFFDFILFTDEATLDSNRNGNGYNFHYHDNVNPHVSRTVNHQHRWSRTVWTGIVGHRVIKPHFFEENLNQNKLKHIFTT